MAEPGHYGTLGADEYDPDSFTRGDYDRLQGERPLDVGGRARSTNDFIENLAGEDLSWHDDAACHPDFKPETMTLADWVDQFFPGRGESTAVARDFCQDCPVKAKCATYADGPPAERTGIWGGLSERERRRSRRARGLSVGRGAAIDRGAA